MYAPKGTPIIGCMLGLTCKLKEPTDHRPSLDGLTCKPRRSHRSLAPILTREITGRVDDTVGGRQIHATVLISQFPTLTIRDRTTVSEVFRTQGHTSFADLGNLINPGENHFRGAEAFESLT